MTTAPRLETPWDELLDGYFAAVPRIGYPSRYARAVERAERAVDAVAGFVRWADVEPAEVTAPLVVEWLARPGPRPYPVKVERAAMTAVLDYGSAHGLLPANPLTALGAWDELLDHYAATAGGAAASLTSHRKRVGRFARWAGVAPADVNEALIVRYLAEPGWSESTRSSARASLRLVLGHAAAAGLLPSNPAQLLPVTAAGGGRAWEQIAVAARGPRDHQGETPHVDARVFPQHPCLRWAEATGRPAAPGMAGGTVPADLLAEWEAVGSPVVTFTDDPLGAVWDRLLIGYAVRAAAAGRMTSTIHQRYQALARFARWADVAPADVDEDLVVRYLSHPDWQPEYRRSNRAALRVVLRYAFKAGYLLADPTVDLDSIRVPVSAPRPAPEAVVSAALVGIRPRVRLMILLGALAGCRRAEIATLRVDAITDDGLRIIGKGGRVRVVPIHTALAPEIEAYLRLADLTEGYIFPGRIDGHLSPGQVGDLVSAALTGPWAAHSLRHRFGTRAYAGAFDIRAVQELLGHSSPATTARYVAVPNTALVNAVAAVPPIPGMGAPPTSDLLAEVLEALMTSPSDDPADLEEAKETNPWADWADESAQ